MRNYAGTCKCICTYTLVCNFLIQVLPLPSSVLVEYFSNAFWHGNKTFPKGSSQNEIVLLLIVFPLPYSQHRGVKICFHPCHYQNQTFSLVSYLCRTRVALVSFVLNLCLNCFVRFALVSLLSGNCVAKQSRLYEYVLGKCECSHQMFLKFLSNKSK